jgi:hypothetical protein
LCICKLLTVACAVLIRITVPVVVSMIVLLIIILVLESDAFTSMTNLKSVTVPDSVKEMDNCGLGMDVDDNYDSVPLKGFKMYCKKGSAAEAYAKENNLSYEIIK